MFRTTQWKYRHKYLFRH